MDSEMTLITEEENRVPMRAPSVSVTEVDTQLTQ